MLICGMLVTYPTKYKRLWVAFPRSALGGAHVPIGSDEGLEADKKKKHYGRTRRHSAGNVACLAALLGMAPALTVESRRLFENAHTYTGTQDVGLSVRRYEGAMD